tara:strand:+ start:279 stop:1190 length:912 start_codon:yes stop_codon:yes gene_type:complete
MSKRKVITLAVEDSFSSLKRIEEFKSKFQSPRYTIELIKIKNTFIESGKSTKKNIQNRQAFIEHLNEKVLESDADGAVHSFVNFPNDFPNDLIVAAVNRKDIVGDVIVSQNKTNISEIPDTIVIGTNNVRNNNQLSLIRNDLSHELLTDSSFTQLLDWYSSNKKEKALIVSHDDFIFSESPNNFNFSRLPIRHFTPAPGQGSIAIVTLDENKPSKLIHASLDNPRARVETMIEHIVFSNMTPKNSANAGIHAIVRGEYVHVTVQLFGKKPDEYIRTYRDLPIRTYAESAKEFSKELNKMAKKK